MKNKNKAKIKKNKKYKKTLQFFYYTVLQTVELCLRVALILNYYEQVFFLLWPYLSFRELVPFLAFILF